MYFSPLPDYLVPLRHKYSPQHLILTHPQPTFLPQCERPSFTPIQNNRQNYIFVYLNVQSPTFVVGYIMTLRKTCFIYLRYIYWYSSLKLSVFQLAYPAVHTCFVGNIYPKFGEFAPPYNVSYSVLTPTIVSIMSTMINNNENSGKQFRYVSGHLYKYF
jgi:hypothetical protein